MLTGVNFTYPHDCVHWGGVDKLEPKTWYALSRPCFEYYGILVSSIIMYYKFWNSLLCNKDLQFDVQRSTWWSSDSIDQYDHKIGRPSYWPSILPLSKSYKGTPLLKKKESKVKVVRFCRSIRQNVGIVKENKNM